MRYALGAGELSKVKTPEYAVAAFRARDPFGSSSELQHRIKGFGPDGPTAASYGLNMSEIASFAENKYAARNGMPNFLPVASDDPNFPDQQRRQNFLMTMAEHLLLLGYRKKYGLYPTILLHDNTVSWFSGTEPYNWLHNRGFLFALYAKRMLQNIDSVGSYWHGDFEVLFDPDVSLSGNGRYVLVTAMSSKNNDLSRLAADALISAVTDCRIGAAAYGEAMAQFLPSGVITVVRWTRSLRDMARVSTRHAYFVWQSLSVLLQKTAITPTQQIPFLELLAEIQVGHGIKPDDNLRQLLATLSGSGKAPKLAKTLLACNRSNDTEQEAALQDLEARIERAERWASWAQHSRKVLPV